MENTVLIVLLKTRKTDRDALCPIMSFSSVWRRWLAAFALALCGPLLYTVASAQTGSHGIVDASSLSYKGGITKAPYSRPAQSVLTGQVQLAVKLSDPPLVVAVGANAKQNGITMSAAQQSAYLGRLKQKQDAVMSQIAALGGVELGRVSKGHNAIMISIDAKQLSGAAQYCGRRSGASGGRYHDQRIPFRRSAGSKSSASVADAQPDLPTTLAYIGGTAVQNSGITGQGVKIAMLDTGIDYTHYNLGGSGNPADYLAATAVASGVPPANLFPTAKVVGGYDFTGEVWPNGPLAPDPNPIDLNGHGTLTSDTAGGHSLDGLHSGTAPGSQLYAVKVCSSVSTACSGVAILEGIDFALDPNNTGTLNNPVDIISMSLGGPFGQREDDEAEAITDVVNFGLVAVIAAANSGDIPYVIGGPGSTPEAIAVAATNSVVASGIPLVINSPASIAGSYTDTATVPFAPIDNTISGNIVYVGRGCPAGSTGAGSPPILSGEPRGRDCTDRPRRLQCQFEGGCGRERRRNRRAHRSGSARRRGFVFGWRRFEFRSHTCDHAGHEPAH